MDENKIAEALIARVRQDFDGQIPSLPNYGYPDSLALCAIDSVYSLAARYSTTRNVVARYRDSRGANEGEVFADSLEDLIRAIDEAGGATPSASTLFNNRQVAPGTKRRKSEALYGAISSLVGLGISTVPDIRAKAMDSEGLDAAKKAWTRESGLGYASWRYFLMLAGVPGVKIDRMVSRYVEGVVGHSVAHEQIESAFAVAAKEFGVEVNELDHAIWRKQSGRVN